MTDLSEPQIGTAPFPTHPQRAARGPWIQLLDPIGFEWNRITLPIPDLADGLVGLRIIHLSDIHLTGHWLSALDRVLSRIADNPPDLLICTGDFVDNKRNHLPALPFVRKLIDGFVARLGCFGVMGNHDGKLADDLNYPKLMLLDCKRHTLDHQGAAIELIGLPRILKHQRADPTVVPVLAPKADGDLRIVLSHHPDYLPMTRTLAPDLFLTGHTHGGQVCLPGGFPILKHSPLPRRLCSGTHRIENTWLVANRGMGFSNLPVRLFCPAEVIEIELSRSE